MYRVQSPGRYLKKDGNLIVISQEGHMDKATIEGAISESHKCVVTDTKTGKSKTFNAGEVFKFPKKKKKKEE